MRRVGCAAARRAGWRRAKRRQFRLPRQFRGGLTRALQAPVSAVHRHARRVQVRVARCTGRRGVGGARGAPSSRLGTVVQAHLGERCGPAAAQRAAREARGSIARVGCLLCRVRCAVTPSAGCARADATRRSAAPLRQPRRAQPRRRHGHELTCTRRCTSGKRARRCRCSAPGGSRPGGAGRPLHGHFSRYTTVSTTRLVISAGTLLCRRHSWSLQPVHYCVDDTVPHLPASRHYHRHTTCWLCVGDTGHTNAVPRHRL